MWTWGIIFQLKNPFPAERDGARLAPPALTTVLLVGVVLAVVVPITHPGAPDALAIVTVEVKRRTGGQH